MRDQWQVETYGHFFQLGHFALVILVAVLVDFFNLFQATVKLLSC